MIERLLAFAGCHLPHPGSRLAAFRIYVLMHLTAESWSFASAGEVAPGSWGLAVATGHTLLFAAGLTGRAARAVTAGAAGLLAVQIATTWPGTANHLYLSMYCLALLSALDARDGREGTLLLQALRWLTAIVFAATGLQKLLYGTYFRGQFLAFVIAEDDRFAVVPAPRSGGRPGPVVVDRTPRSRARVPISSTRSRSLPPRTWCGCSSWRFRCCCSSAGPARSRQR